MDLRGLSAFFEDRIDTSRAQLRGRLSPEAYDEFLRPLLPSLYQRLYEISHRCLVAQFMLLGKNSEFDDYCHSLRSDEVRSYLYERFPLLGKALDQACSNWVEQGELIARRLTEDRHQLAFLLGGQPPGRVEHIQLCVGDPHRGGAGVALVSFDNGRLLYKPRSLSIDSHFDEMVGWLNAKAGLDLATVRHIDRGAYGWVEFVQHLECEDEAAVERFYTRLGALLALLYILEATDFHYENIIACGEQPCLIDLESMFHPVRYAVGAGTNEAFDFSILKVGILPSRSSVGNPLPQASAMADVDGRPGIERADVVLSPDGGLSMARHRPRLGGSQNVPRLGGESMVPTARSVECMQAGFASAYRAVLADSLHFQTMVERCRGDVVRIVLRHTAAYTHLLDEARHPVLLADPEGTRAHYARLRTAVADARTVEQFVDHEIEALHNGDVPFFTTQVGSCDLFYSDHQALPAFFQMSGLDAVLRKLELLSEEDLARQLWIIRNACDHRSLQALASVATEPVIPMLKEGDRAQRLLAQAQAIACRIRAQMHVTDDHASWLVHKSRALDNSVFELVPAFYDLHSGMPGEILFFAHLADVTGELEHRRLADKALAYLVTRLRQSGDSIQTLGLYAGWGSVLHLLERIARLHADYSSLALAQEWLESPQFEKRIAADSGYGVLTGAAGFIIACTALYRTAGVDRALELAERAAAHLLEHRHAVGPGSSWRISSARPLSGLAHGASGFAVAFAHLFEATGESRYRSASLQALEFERSLFLPEQGNWRDCRDVVIDRHGDIPYASVSWAHGAPGIGLARLALIDAGIDSDRLREELDIALATTLAYSDSGGHSLIAGAFGRLELPLCHAQWAGAPSGLAFDAQVDGLLSDLEAGELRLNEQVREPIGLMAGLTGIGYQCLRLAFPDRVESVLCGIRDRGDVSRAAAAVAQPALQSG